MIIRRAEVKWVSVHKPNTKYTPRWEVNIYPDEKGIAQLEDAGLVLKTDKNDGRKYYKATRNVHKKNGEALDPPNVVDAGMNQFTRLIGNGSICNVKLYIREIDAFGKKAMKGYLDSVQVIKHVPYDDGEDFEVEEEEFADDGEY